MKRVCPPPARSVNVTFRSQSTRYTEAGVCSVQVVVASSEYLQEIVKLALE